ncbi:hypothetical protein BH24GEM2_BH24GEM2_06180 [soil metagenome]
MRSKILGAILLIATFVAGGLAGAASLRVLNAAEPTPALPPGSHCHGPHEKGGGKWLEQLDLSAEQRTRVEQIMERRRAQMGVFWENEGSRLRVLVDSTRNEVRSVLTPGQRAEYDRLRAERKASRKGHHSGNLDMGRDGAR